ncbi:hypothetical protein G7054_g4295 [Neopestalotiopsis clavispora]|nr:hypothetical protein G7054_g4295 [Neopestalotiopsis clavispora]
MPSVAEPAHSPLDRLPVELLAAVLSFLPGRDIKNLRLTGKSVCSRTPLHLHRVFLSANPRNIEVLRAVAEHDVLRHGVSEIILDDALLGYIDCINEIVPDGALRVYKNSSDLEDDEDATDDSEGTHSFEGGEEGVPYAFDRACRQNIQQALERQDMDVPRPNHVLIARQIKQQLPRRDSWRYFRQLLQQQDDVIKTEADAKALRYGLERFTSLRRVTITPVAHGVLYEPLYETPMIRAFPCGFNYPIPCSWALYKRGRPYSLQSWDKDNEEQSDKGRWRGFSVASGELSTFGQRVKELVIDVAHLTTGLNYQFFVHPCQEYDNLLNVLRQPGFSRIDLSILADGQQFEGWPVLFNGRLKSALDAAADLQHVSLGVLDPLQLYRILYTSTSPSSDFTPLRDIFPIDRWPKLRHFGLSNLLVQQDDLLSLLAALPLTLRSVDLSFLNFMEGGDYRGLLDGMRQNLAWHERPVRERPRVFVNIRHGEQAIRYFCLDKEVDDFFYGTGENPFMLEGDRSYPQNYVSIIRDPFDPTHDRPNTGTDELIEMGIVRE